MTSERKSTRLHQGDLAEGEVVELVFGPEARGLADGLPVRVAGGVPGDRGTMRIVHAGRNATWARMQDVQRPSPDRVPTPCPVVDRCGGCPWQAVSVEAQREAKGRLTRAALGDLADGATFRPVEGAEGEASPTPTGFRTRALMMTRHLHGRLRLGFFAPRSNDLVPAEGCVVQDPTVNRVLEEVVACLERASLSSWRDAGRRGLLRAVLFRVDPAIGQGLLTLVVSEFDVRLRRIGHYLLDIEGVSGVFANINPAPGGSVLGPENRHLAGATRQTFRYGDMDLELGPTAFVQTHHRAAELLWARVRELVPERSAHLADVYSGAGLFGLALRDRADRVTLVEQNPHAHEDAVHNVARLEHTDHVQCRAGDASELVPALFAGQAPPDTVILDPPRAGCSPQVVEAVAAARSVKSVIYASCNPRSLARDLAVLRAGGLRVETVAPVDMFPHTPHLEVVVRLGRHP